jgi:hypothetical protein
MTAMVWRRARTILALLTMFALGQAAAAERPPVFVGKQYKVAYGGGPSLLLDFKSDTFMEGTFLEGSNMGQKLSITFTAKEIGDGLYMLYWQEQDKTTVVHVDDFRKMVSYSNITLPDGTFLNFSGPLTPAN